MVEKTESSTNKSRMTLLMHLFLIHEYILVLFIEIKQIKYFIF